MHAYILGGENPKAINERWGQAVVSQLGDTFDSTQIVDYDLFVRQSLEKGHPNNLEMHINQEGARLGAMAEAQQGSYAAIATSAGGWAVLKAMKQHGFKPDMAILAGFPYVESYRRGVPINHFLNDLEVPITIVQETNDPEGSYEGLVELLGDRGAQNVRTIEVSDRSPVMLGLIVAEQMPADGLAA